MTLSNTIKCFFGFFRRECRQVHNVECRFVVKQNPVNFVSKQEKECRPFSNEQCVVNYETVCQTVYEKTCRTVEKTDYKQQCKNVQDQQCVDVLETM